MRRLALAFIISGFVLATPAASAQPSVGTTVYASYDLTTDIVCTTLKTETVETSMKRFVQRLAGGPRAVAGKLAVATVGAALTFCDELVAKARSVAKLGMSWLLGSSPQPPNSPPIVFVPQERVRGEAVLPSDGYVPVTVFWNAFDLDGIRTHDLQVFEGSNQRATRLSTRQDTLRNYEVAPGQTYQFTVRSQDKRGKWSQFMRGTPFHIDLISEEAAGRSTGWSVHANSEALDGRDRFSSVGGAWMSYRFHGDYVAWVGPTWPSGGFAEVYVDRIRRQTVNLASSLTTHRSVLSAWQWPLAGDHEILVKVQSGGVEVDGFIVID